MKRLILLLILALIITLAGSGRSRATVCIDGVCRTDPPVAVISPVGQDGPAVVIWLPLVRN